MMLIFYPLPVEESPPLPPGHILLSFLVDSEFIDYGALRSVYDRMQAGEMRRHLRDYAEEQRQSLERLCAGLAPAGTACSDSATAGMHCMVAIPPGIYLPQECINIKSICS